MINIRSYLPYMSLAIINNIKSQNKAKCYSLAVVSFRERVIIVFLDVNVRYRLFFLISHLGYSTLHEGQKGILAILTMLRNTFISGV